MSERLVVAGIHDIISASKGILSPNMASKLSESLYQVTDSYISAKTANGELVEISPNDLPFLYRKLPSETQRYLVMIFKGNGVMKDEFSALPSTHLLSGKEALDCSLGKFRFKNARRIGQTLTFLSGAATLLITALASKLDPMTQLAYACGATALFTGMRADFEFRILNPIKKKAAKADANEAIHTVCCKAFVATLATGGMPKAAASKPVQPKVSCTMPRHGFTVG